MKKKEKGKRYRLSDKYDLKESCIADISLFSGNLINCIIEMQE
jgi:hypothetical protein